MSELQALELLVVLGLVFYWANYKRKPSSKRDSAPRDMTRMMNSDTQRRFRE